MAKVRGGAKLRAALNAAKRARGVRSVKVGFFKTAKHPDGTPVAAVAAWQEFGTHRDGQTHIPERPFMRNAVRKSREDVREVIEAGIDPKTLAVSGQLAGRVGALVKGAIQKEIVNLREPPNAPSTLKAKKPKSNPLIDTGTLRTAVTWRVEL